MAEIRTQADLDRAEVNSVVGVVTAPEHDGGEQTPIVTSGILENKGLGNQGTFTVVHETIGTRPSQLVRVQYDLSEDGSKVVESRSELLALGSPDYKHYERRLAEARGKMAEEKQRRSNGRTKAALGLGAAVLGTMALVVALSAASKKPSKENKQPYIVTYLLGRRATLWEIDGDGQVDGIGRPGSHQGLEWVAKGYETKIRGYHPSLTKVMPKDFRRAASDLLKAHQNMEAQLRGEE